MLMLTHYSVMALPDINIGFRDINRVMSYITSLAASLLYGPLMPLFFMVWTSSGRWAEFGPTWYPNVTASICGTHVGLGGRAGGFLACASTIHIISAVLRQQRNH